MAVLSSPQNDILPQKKSLYQRKIHYLQIQDSLEKNFKDAMHPRQINQYKADDILYLAWRYLSIYPMWHSWFDEHIILSSSLFHHLSTRVPSYGDPLVHYVHTIITVHCVSFWEMLHFVR